MISFGSETSGGIRKVVAYQNRGLGTSEGIRFKSAKTRGGYVEDILIRDLQLENVPLPFTFTLNWNPSYSYATIPPDLKNIPPYWRVLSTPVAPPERGLCEFRNITIENVAVVGAFRVFSAAGLPEKPLTNVKWINVSAQANEAGSIESAVCEREPRRRCRRWRSSGVSTSSTRFGTAATTTCRPRASACERKRAALSCP